jgi:hypothetical protein
MKITWHAKHQIDGRGLSLAWVEKRLAQAEAAVLNCKSAEVRVVLQVLPAVHFAQDGSNGDTIVACIDREKLTVKTVMLRCKYQIRPQDGVAYVVPKGCVK